MSDTPRTDARVHVPMEEYTEWNECVSADFARTLERELAESRANHRACVESEMEMHAEALATVRYATRLATRAVEMSGGDMLDPVVVPDFAPKNALRKKS